MEYEFTNQFVKDLKRFATNKVLLNIVAKKIQHVAKADSLDDITELIAIRKTTSHYRIKIKLPDKTKYRIGIKVLRKTVWFACLENDKKRFYKNFP